MVGKAKEPEVRRSPRLTIEVSREIIQNATQRDSSHCMIADAVRAAVPNAEGVEAENPEPKNEGQELPIGNLATRREFGLRAMVE